MEGISRARKSICFRLGITIARTSYHPNNFIAMQKFIPSRYHIVLWMLKSPIEYIPGHEEVFVLMYVATDGLIVNCCGKNKAWQFEPGRDSAKMENCCLIRDWGSSFSSVRDREYNHYLYVVTK